MDTLGLIEINHHKFKVCHCSLASALFFFLISIALLQILASEIAREALAHRRRVELVSFSFLEAL